MPLVVLFSVWLRHVLVAILTSIVQCTRHTAGFGNIILLSNVELFQHVKWRVFGCTVLWQCVLALLFFGFSKHNTHYWLW